MSEEKDTTLVDLGERVKGKIELPRIDLKQYIGKSSKIELVTEHKGNYGFYVKVQSEIIDTWKGVKDIELRASVILGLHEDKEGNLGWDDSTKMGIFLKKMNVKHYRELIGKEVVVQTRTNKEGLDFLTFI